MPEGLSDHEEMDETPEISQEPVRRAPVILSLDRLENILKLMIQPLSSESKSADVTESKPTPSRE